jgi:hypothetical protein
MERERIIFFRNFFFAAFIIGLIFALFYFGATVLFWNTGCLVGDALLQNRRERIWKTGFIVFHPAARRARIFLSRAGFGSALDGEEEIINRVMKRFGFVKCL